MAVGDDAACLFFEVWYTSCNSNIRCVAKGIAQELLEKYERHLLQPELCRCGKCRLPGAHVKTKMDARELFLQLMFLLRCKEEMGLDIEKMAAKADSLWKDCGFQDNTSRLFRITPENLSEVSDAEFTVLIMHIMVMEFNQMLFPRRWPIRWGLREVFTHLKTRKYCGPPYDAACKFHDCFYFTTHIAFAISAYSAIKTQPKDVPWLFEYNRRACLYWTQQAWRRSSGRQPDRLVDIDGLSEAVDVMRGCGLTDGGDPLLCSATLAILELQRPDGSWPYWEIGNVEGLTANEPQQDELPYYHRLHPTWVAVQSLRDRNFEQDRKGNICWSQFMARLLKETKLGRLNSKIVYAWPARKKKGKPSMVLASCSGVVETASAAVDEDAAEEENLTDVHDLEEEICAEEGLQKSEQPDQMPLAGSVSQAAEMQACESHSC